jgi:hypothetical protein
MRYSIHQISATQWELRDNRGFVVGTFSDAVGRTGYDLALSALGGIMTTELSQTVPADTTPAGLLPEVWMSDAGIAFSERLPGGRDFTNCTWSWRDPTSTLVPLMLQTQTDFGHQGAELAGFVEEFTQQGGVVSARGQFYDNEMGVQARDVLLDGRRFGVSVDPTENVVAEFTCTEFDEDDWCIDGDVVFSEYEIGGLTMCPFPGFVQASIVLSTESEGAATDTGPNGQLAAMKKPKMPKPMEPMKPMGPMIASAAPSRPPAEWFRVPEPLLGQEWLPEIQGDEVLVDQGDGTMACPLTITDEGLIYGHVYRLGQCHTADPWGPGVCATAVPSANGYATFHTGSVACDDGSLVATGSIVVGAEHSYAASTWAAIDHYANAGSGWADVRVIDGEQGAWCCGALRPGLSDDQLRVLRALSLSGEWRDVGGNLELIGILSVNQPGFPIARQQLAASGFVGIADAGLRITSKGDRVVRMSGAGIVSACPECQKRRQVAGNGRAPRGEDVLASAQAFNTILARLDVLEQRTRQLIGPAAELARERLHR